MELLDRALVVLPAETRTVLIKRYIAEEPHSEIAAHLGISDKAVSMRLSRGKLLLKHLLMTTLRDEAIEYGLIQAEVSRWQDTRVWCLQCGKQRLLIHLPTSLGTVSFRCSHCSPDPEVPHSSYSLTNPHFAQMIGGLTRPRSILNRTSLWAHDYFMRAIEAKTVVCTNCGCAAHVHRAHYADPLAMPGDQLVYIECAACGEIVSQSFQGLVTVLPQVQQFWRVHARLRMLPHYEIETAGQSALVTRFESVVDTACLDVVVARDTLKVLSIHGTSTVERCS